MWQAMSVMGGEAGYESGYATFTVNLKLADDRLL